MDSSCISARLIKPVQCRNRIFGWLIMVKWRESVPSSGARVDGVWRLRAFCGLLGLICLATVAGADAKSRGTVGAGVLAPPLASATVKPALPSTVASAVHLEDSGDRAELRFDLSRPVTTNAFVLTAPDRVVIDLPEVDFQVAPQAGGTTKLAYRRRSFRERRRPVAFSGLIASFRFGLFAAGRSRIVINLAGPAKIQCVAAQRGADGKTAVLVIELAKTGRAAFQAAARRAVLAAAAEAVKPHPVPASASAVDTPGNLPVVVVDPGHGGVDSGAMVNGLVEKNIVLAFANALAKKLAATHDYKVVMTRDSDVFIPLGGRVRIAREAHAALFVSVHADTIADAASVSGATIYTMSDRASDAEAARTAEKENQSDATAGLDGAPAPSGVSDILFDLTKRETRAYSHVFARTLVNYWKVAGRLNKNPERAAGFIVLTAPDVPSILLELGYLSNVKDAKSLVSPEWRDETTSKVVAAINAFFETRGRSSTAAGPIGGTK